MRCPPCKPVRACLGPVMLAFALVACAGPGYSDGFDAPDSAARLHGVVAAARTADRDALPRIVAMLASEDPAARILSIRTLERMTGETLGYDHAAPRHQRDAAIKRWNQWLLDHGYSPSSMPADGDPFRSDRSAA